MTTQEKFNAAAAAQIKVYETQIWALNVAKDVIGEKFNGKVLNARLANEISKVIKTLRPDERLTIRIKEDYKGQPCISVYDGKNRGYTSSEPDRNGYYTTGYVQGDTIEAALVLDKDTQRINAPLTLVSLRDEQLRLYNLIDEVTYDVRHYEEAVEAYKQLQEHIKTYENQFSYRLRWAMENKRAF